MTVAPFNKSNLYIFLIEFGFSLLFLFAFTCVHYSITRSTKLGKKLEQSKVLNFWYFFVFGFILSLITFAVSQVSSIAIGAIGMPLTIIGLIYAMTVFYNRSVQMGAIIPTILWVLYQYNGFVEFNYEWLIRLIIVVIIAAVAITTTFIKWKPWPTFLISVGVTLVLLVIILLCNINDYTAYYVVSSTIALLATIFYYVVIKYLNRWLMHMSKMARQGAYVDKHYLIPTVLDEYFDNFVKKNNVKQALVVSLNLIGNDKEKNKILEKIYDKFVAEKPLFFKSSYETYGLILANKNYYIKDLSKSYSGNKCKLRSEDDDLKYFEQQIHSLNSKNITVNAYVSIYGVHSCRLDSLLKDNNYAFKHDDFEHDHNAIQIFSTNITNQEINDDIAFTTLSQKINLNDINVELELLRMKKSKKIYVCPRYYWPKMLTCDVDTITGQFGINVGNSLLRYLASKSLEQYANNKQYQQYPILIYYPVDQLNSNLWSINEFIKKIHLFGLKRENIILSFNVAKYKAWPKLVIDNLIDLESHNIKYILVDINNVSGIEKLKPLGIILNKKVTKDKHTLHQTRDQKLNIL